MVFQRADQLAVPKVALRAAQMDSLWVDQWGSLVATLVAPKVAQMASLWVDLWDLLAALLVAPKVATRAVPMVAQKAGQWAVPKVVELVALLVVL